MKRILLILSLLISQTFAFSQDNKVSKIAKYISKDKWNDARELLDELDNIPKYKNDIDYWFVRTCYYKAAIATHINSDKELYKIEIIEAKKSFEKLVEFDKTDTSKSYSEYIPQFRKEIYNEYNETINKSSETEDDAKTVTLTEEGQGKSKDEAKYSALRNILEKAFGAFISSNTTLLNDNLIKDEIVSLSSGNIQNFDILSETKMPDGTYTSIVKATVSIGKLIAFCESKGITVEFKGSLFATNAKIKKLREDNFRQVLNNLNSQMENILLNGDFFDYTIAVTEPEEDFDHKYGYNKWFVRINVTATINNNIKAVRNLITQTGYSPNMDLFIPYLETNSQNFIISNGITEDSCSNIKNCIDESKLCNYANEKYEKFFSYQQVGSIFYSDDLKMRYNFIQILTLDQISKITEYKVEPIR